MLMPYNTVQYIKKEDVYSFVCKQRIATAMIFFSMAIVVTLMWVYVYPQMLNVYNTFDTPLPSTIEKAPYIFAIIAAIHTGIGIYFLVNKPNEQSVLQKISGYKEGEMIHIKNFAENKIQAVALLLMGITVGLIIIILVKPIYNLTNNL